MSDLDELKSLIGQAADVMDASGVVVWVGSPDGSNLQPALSHGYPPQVMVRMSTIPRSADNAAAAAFRTSQLQFVLARPGESNGAVIGPAAFCGGLRGRAVGRNPRRRRIVGKRPGAGGYLRVSSRRILHTTPAAHEHRAAERARGRFSRYRQHPFDLVKGRRQPLHFTLRERVASAFSRLVGSMCRVRTSGLVPRRANIAWKNASSGRRCRWPRRLSWLHGQCDEQSRSELIRRHRASITIDADGKPPDAFYSLTRVTRVRRAAARGRSSGHGSTLTVVLCVDPCSAGTADAAVTVAACL